LGGSFAASLITLFWTRRASVHHARLAESINPYNPNAQKALNAFGPEHHRHAMSMINGGITQQGLQISFNEIFHVLGWIFVALIAICWLAKPPFIGRTKASAGKPSANDDSGGARDAASPEQGKVSA
jgi:DHA2 family multidrug resistance protein